MKKVVTKSLEETYAVAADFWQWLKKRYEHEDMLNPVLALYGDLGAGKTAFVQGLAKAIGIEETITSPTFVLMKRYPIEIGNLKLETGITQLVHIDAYRFERANELVSLRWEELLKEPRNLIALEWPERVAAALPPDTTIPLHFRFVDETTREITLPYD